MESKLVGSGTQALFDLPSSVQSFVVMAMVAGIVALAFYVIKLRKKMQSHMLTQEEALLEQFRAYMLESKARDELQKKAIFAIVKDRLGHLCNVAIQADFVASRQFESITNMYNAYSEMSGNGYIHELYEKVKKLPHEQKECMKK